MYEIKNQYFFLLIESIAAPLNGLLPLGLPWLEGTDWFPECIWFAEN